MFQSLQEYSYSDVDADGDIFTIVTPIAYCEVTQRLVVVKSEIVQASPSDEPEKKFNEISFAIDVISLDDAYEQFSTQDRGVAARFIPERSRDDIIHIVANQYQQLLAVVQPKYLYRVTKQRDNFKKSLRKHDFLTSKLIEFGYVVIEAGKDVFRRDYWLMERVDAERLDIE
jgi:hypothetical protein